MSKKKAKAGKVGERKSPEPPSSFCFLGPVSGGVRMMIVALARTGHARNWQKKEGAWGIHSPTFF
jgi:hypothetical protein